MANIVYRSVSNMKPQFTSAYLDSLFEPGNYENLIQITSLLTGSSAFDSSKSDFGLGDDLFALVESLGWFAQSVRSGSWTYFETTPSSRQARMLDVLRISGPPGFTAKYEYGMTHWRDAERLNDLDLWIDGADGANNNWLWALAALRRREILAIIT